MKVIRKPANFKSWWVGARPTCDYCKTEVLLEETDPQGYHWRPEQTSPDGTEVRVAFDCPTCGRLVTLRMSKPEAIKKESPSSPYDEERARLTALHRPLMSEFFMGSPSAHGPAHLPNVEGEIASLIDKICLDGGDKKLVRVIEWLISILGSSVKLGSFNVYKKVLAEMLREC